MLSTQLITCVTSASGRPPLAEAEVGAGTEAETGAEVEEEIAVEANGECLGDSTKAIKC